jgi:hypothetical protein
LLFGLWSVSTSVFGWCPFYRMFGVNTCPTTFQNAEVKVASD